jgi:hypothetical protein
MATADTAHFVATSAIVPSGPVKNRSESPAWRLSEIEFYGEDRQGREGDESYRGRTLRCSRPFLAELFFLLCVLGDRRGKTIAPGRPPEIKSLRIREFGQ